MAMQQPQDDWFAQNAPQGQGSPLGQMVANSQRRMAGAPQLDPSIGSFTPFVGETKYYDKATGQAIDPSDPRIAAYTQAMQHFGQSQGLIDPNVVNRAAQQATGGGQNGATNWGDLQSRLNPNTDIAQWVRDGFQAQGKTANDNDINTWSNYWNQWGKNDPGYFFQRFSTPDGGGQQAGAGGGFGGTGSLINKLPSVEDLKANPGFQYAIDEAQRGMQNSAAAKGTLLNGRTNQAMTQNLANYALGNFYMPLANLGLQYNQANVGNLYNLANLGLSGSSVGGQ